VLLRGDFTQISTCFDSVHKQVRFAPAIAKQFHADVITEKLGGAGMGRLPAQDNEGARFVALWFSADVHFQGGTMNSVNPDYFIHAGNVVLLLAYSVRDIFWLRLFALASSLIAIPYFVFQPTPLWAPLSWSALFAAVNLFQSWRLFLERRPVKLTPEEEDVRQLVFKDLPPRKVLQVLSIGSWTTAETGERLIEHGQSAETISLVVRGKVRVTRDERVLADLVAGNIVGSALLLSGVPADVDAVVVEPVRAIRWEVGTLERYLTANPETRIIMQRHLARDLAGKLDLLTNRSQETIDPNGKN
jgi:CRP-like cAMP-binding protein